MRCDYYRAGVCRSCTHLEVPYPEQVVAKDRRVRDLLSAVVPADAWRVPFVGPESGFRNKAKLVAGGTTGAVTLGILDPPGRGVDLRECGLHEAAIVAALLPLAGFVDDIGLIPYAVPERRGELKHVLVTAAPGGALMIRFVLRSTAQLALIRNRLGLLLDSVPGADVVSVNIQPEHKAILEGEREIILSPNDSLRMPLGPVPLYLQPGGFFQTNTVVAQGLYAQATSWIADAEPGTVWDIYCGVGGFALHAAYEGRRVAGIELSPSAIAAAQRSAADLGLDEGQAVFRVEDAGASADTLPGPPGVVVVNPPRRGLDADLVRWLDDCPAQTMIYSSCNPQTLARDLAALSRWTVREARLFDMFPQTDHSEVAVRLGRPPSRTQ